MGAVKVLAVLVFVMVWGTQTLLLPDDAYAYCSCNMTCPTPKCQCDPYCAVNDFKNFQPANFQIRSVQSSALFAGTWAEVDNGGVLRLIAVPQAFLKLQCQRLTEMLSWVSDLQISNRELQATLR